MSYGPRRWRRFLAMREEFDGGIARPEALGPLAADPSREPGPCRGRPDGL